LASENVMGWVVEVVDLFGLPGTKTLGKIHVLIRVSRGGHLFGKRRGISSQIKCFGGQHTRRVMVGVVLSGGEIGEKSEDYRRAR
jgi:hypothetical protein